MIHRVRHAYAPWTRGHGMCMHQHVACVLMLCVFLPELFSDCRSESVLVLQVASLVLACKSRSLQLPGEANLP